MTEIIIATLLGVFVVATGIFSLIRFNKDMKTYGECKNCGKSFTSKESFCCENCGEERNGGAAR